MKNKCCSGRFKPETERKLGASLNPSTSAGVRCGVEYARRGGGWCIPSRGAERTSKKNRIK